MRVKNWLVIGSLPESTQASWILANPFFSDGTGEYRAVNCLCWLALSGNRIQIFSDSQATEICNNKVGNIRELAQIT